MEAEVPWRGLRGVFRRFFFFFSRERQQPLTTSSPCSSPSSSSCPTSPSVTSSSSSRNSFISAVEGDAEDEQKLAIVEPLRSVDDYGLQRGGYVPLHCPRTRRRESRSVSPCKRFSVAVERAARLHDPRRPSQSWTRRGDRTRSEDRRASRAAARGSIAPLVAGGSGSGRRSQSEEPSGSGSEGEASDEDGASSSFGWCEAERRLETLIRDRGYHVKEHVPRRLMEEKIMENIRRRERIAIMMRNEAAKNAGVDRTISTADELTSTNAAAGGATAPKKGSPKARPARASERIGGTPPTQRSVSEGVYVDPLKLQHVLGLVSKVWTKRPPVAQRAENRVVEWARQEFIGECVEEHNRYRQLHGVPPLEICERLSEDAQIWADRLARSKIIEYSSVDGRGENILMSSAVSRGGFTGKGVTKAWYDKGRKFNHGAVESANMAHVGSFTQVIWKSTKKIGIGMSRSDCGRIVAVARYYPRGNVPGEVSENVPPLVKINPFDLPTFSKTREEANLNVQTALVAPEICAGVARFYAAPLKEPPPSARRSSLLRAAKYSKMNGLYPPREQMEAPKETRRASALCPNGRLIQVCCGAPSLTESSPVSQEIPSPPPVVRTRPQRESLRLLAPAALESENRPPLVQARRNPFNTRSDDPSKAVEIGLHTLPTKRVKIRANQSATRGQSSPLRNVFRTVPRTISGRGSFKGDR